MGTLAIKKALTAMADSFMVFLLVGNEVLQHQGILEIQRNSAFNANLHFSTA
jgi:hypothetical protein